MSVALMASYDSLYPESECEVLPNLHGYITGISQRAVDLGDLDLIFKIKNQLRNIIFSMKLTYSLNHIQFEPMSRFFSDLHEYSYIIVTVQRDNVFW